MDVNTFVNPPAEYRITAFWFWNGMPEDGEIVRQIGEMSQKGVGGFCLVARSGLRVPYLSQIWMQRVQLAVETASFHGLQVWLHEEYPYPGGRSGGQVTLGHPEYRAQHLTFCEITVQGGQQVDMELPWGTVLRAMAVPLRRDRCLWEDAEDIGKHIGADQRLEIYRESPETYHNKQFFTRVPMHRLFWKAPIGRWRVLVFLQRELDSPEFSAAHFDPFNANAVAHFVDTFCAPYIKLLEDAFAAGTIPGIHLSEPSPSSVRLPWSSLLPQVFQKRNGYNLLNHLPALITGFGPHTARIRYDYFQTLSELLRDSYHKVCADWCDRHNLLYSADVPVLRNAHRIHAHVSGSDGGQEKVGAPESREGKKLVGAYRQNPKFPASLAHQQGKPHVFSTCFQDTGWVLTLQDMKWTVDRLGALGSNRFNFHAFFYTLDGLRKHDAPPSQFHQNPYWKHFRLLSDYAGRLSYALSQGRHVADIALLDPVTSLWAHLGHPALDWQYVGYDADEKKLTDRLASDWAYLMESLTQMQRDYDCLDPEMLQQARISDRRLILGKSRYEVLIIPPITNLERGAFECIRKFLNAGGKVVSIGLLPIEDIQEGPSSVDAFSRMTDMEAGRMIRDYIGHELGIHLVQRGDFYLIRTGGSVVQNRGAVVLTDVLDQILPRQTVVHAGRKGGANLLCHQREDGAHRIYFFANPSSAAFDAKIELRSESAAQEKAERWDLESGRRIPLPVEAEKNRLCADLSFAGYQSHLIVVSPGEETVQPPPELPAAIAVDLSGKWKVDPEEDNVLRLDYFRMQPDAHNRGLKQGWHKPEYADSKWIAVSPKPFVEQLREASALPSLPFAFSSSGPEQPTEANVKLPLVCWFRTCFSADVLPTKLALVMDRSAILGAYQIYLNGSRLPSNAFRPTFRYDHANVTCAVGRRLSKGKNVIAIRVEIGKLTEGLVDAFYLFGRFGVKRWRNHYLRLYPQADRGVLGALDDLAMPFYSGTVAYTRDITLVKRPETKQFAISLQDQFKGMSDIVEVLLNGHSLGVRPWAPYGWTGETAILRQGKNRVTLRITNTLSRLLTGREFQPRGHRMAPVKI